MHTMFPITAMQQCIVVYLTIRVSVVFERVVMLLLYLVSS